MADTKHRQPWEPSAEEIVKAIELHAQWLDSEGADGEQLDLGRADLRKFGPQLRGARLDQAKLTQCDLRGVDITGASLVKASLLGAKLDGATICGANLTRANFTSAEIAGADFSESVWNKATFANAMGEAALFCKCRIDMDAVVKEGPNFSNANLPGVWFSSADLSKGQLAHAIMPSAHAEEAVFDRAQMGTVNLQSATLRGASFRHADMSESNLQGADCCQADFASARLATAKLTDADMTDAAFHKADLRSANVRNTIFKRAKGLFGADRAVLDDMVDTEWLTDGIKDGRFRWDHIRNLGSLAIFSASGILLAGIIVYGAVARWFNAHLADFREGLEKNQESQDLVAFVPGPLVMPWELGFLLVAIVVLTIASMFYRIWCPAAIKEYTELFWVRALHAPRLEYLAASNSRVRTRYLTASLYLIGGVYVVGYAIVRVAVTLRFAFSGA